MSGDTRETKSVEKTEIASENNVNLNQTEQREKKNYCYVCSVQCTGERNFKQHKTGRKHLKKLNSSPQDTAKETKKKNNLCKKKTNLSKKKANLSKKASKYTLQPCSEDSKEKTENIEGIATDKTMNYFRNHYSHNNKYNNPDFENRYSKHNYSNNYRNGKHYYNNNIPYNWNSYSNSPGMPDAQNYNFNYRSRNQFYSQSAYDQFPSENNCSYINPFRNYGESSNSGIYEENFKHVNSTDDTSHSENPFKQFYSENTISSSKSPKEKLVNEGTETSASSTLESNASSTNEPTHLTKDYKSAYKKRIVICDTLEKNASSSNEPTHFSKDYKSASKKRIVISKVGEKRTVFRSRSLSSSESDRKRKAKTDHTESEESEEQRIQEWTNSLLETNHNQITRLINPSNHKEKAAVNHLITKFSKSKRKENLTRTLRTNSSELTDNDEKDARSEVVSAENEPLNIEDDEISIILDSKITNSNLEQNVTNICTPSTSKYKNSKCKSTSQDQNNENSLKSSISSKNKNSKMCSKNGNNVKDSNSTSNKLIRNNSSPLRCKEKYVKRKNAGSDTKVKKKQKATILKNNDSSTETENLNKHDSRKAATPKNAFSSHVSTKTSGQNSSASEIKPEMVEAVEVGVDPSSTTISGNNLEETLVFNSDVSVEELIQLFASGNVKVKEEFNDPVMDELKKISPDELINACSNSINVDKETGSKTTTSSANKKHSKDKSLSENHKNNNCINPVILGSASIENSEFPVSAFIVNNSDRTSAVSENICSPSVTRQTESVLPTASTSEKSELHNHSSPCTEIETGLDNPLLNLSELNNTKVELPPYINKLIKELKDVTSEEEKVKENLVEAKSKINEYAALLEKWKKKKKMLQEREECLRVQRNDVIKLMQNAVKTDSDDTEKELATSLLKDDTLSAQSTSKEKQNVENTAKAAEVSEPSLTVPSPGSENLQKQKESESSPRSPESDDIIVIPAPQKPQPVEITIRDDEENVPFSNQSRISRYDLSASMSSNRRSTLYDLKGVNAHATVINCLVVFEDFLYTCSNDSTAKRFNLKDASLSVTYLHAAKNVTEVVVEKVQTEALVFTSCSTRVVSLFIASSGTKLKSFFPPCPVMSICKGWGKFYCGLANGSVNMYNWKYDEIEIVKTEEPASRIATAHQGRLHVLVILSSEGNISIRDAETGLLIRYIKINIKHPSWMCLHSDLVYLSSSDKSLSILDIMSGRIEKKLYMNCHTTGLSVYDDFIFTITYSGVINCYNKDNSCDKKLFYGAGKGCLTCVHVYQNWVFTGNRKGEVSLFHFDPISSNACEFSKCDAVYGLKEDLEYHVEKDHLLKKKTLLHCSWKGCTFKFPRSADVSDKMNHLKSHIYEMNCTPSNVSS